MAENSSLRSLIARYYRVPAMELPTSPPKFHFLNFIQMLKTRKCIPLAYTNPLSTRSLTLYTLKTYRAWKKCLLQQIITRHERNGAHLAVYCLMQLPKWYEPKLLVQEKRNVSVVCSMNALKCLKMFGTVSRHHLPDI